eukprot:gene17418-64135_t
MLAVLLAQQRPTAGAQGRAGAGILALGQRSWSHVAFGVQRPVFLLHLDEARRNDRAPFQRRTRD